MTLAALREHGVTDDTRLKLEFFFYTDARGKADGLAKELADLGYEAKVKPSAKALLVNGWTTRMPMDEHTVVAWSAGMCDLGFKHDCEFDGWGTTPVQPDEN